MFRQLVVWGGCEGGLESHRHIHRAFYENARKLGHPAVWLPDQPESNGLIASGATVIAADIWNKHLRPRKNVNYVVHNFSGDHPVMEETPAEQLLRLQVWTHDAFGEKWDHCRQYSVEGRILFQPWGTDLLAEEFLEPVFNPTSREAVFVGAIWREMLEGTDLGNEDAINHLRNTLRENGLTFHHLTQVSVEENVNSVRNARLAPAIAGGWQVEHGYLPCRIFKNISYGALGFTNVPTADFICGHFAGSSIEELIPRALGLRRDYYEAAVRAQQRVVARYTYRESLQAIERALPS